MPNQSTNLDCAFRALADPTRRAVLQRLAKGSTSVSDLAQPFEMALPSFMQHLQVLETGGLITTRKVGRTRTCAMQPQALVHVQSWLEEQRSVWTARLDSLDAYLLNLQTPDQAP